jgi:Mor family transcriptional regulator
MSLKESVARLIKDDIFESLLASELCNDEKALELAANIFIRIQQKWGGNDVHIPKVFPEERRQQIRAAFDGSNHAAVCQQFGISLKTFYRAISE